MHSLPYLGSTTNFAETLKLGGCFQRDFAAYGKKDTQFQNS